MSFRPSQTILKNLILLSSNAHKTQSFFTEIMGLKLVHQSEANHLYELTDKHNFRLIIKQSSNLAQTSCGYSPLLNFEIPQSEDFQDILDRAQTHYNIELDGSLHEDQYSRVQALQIQGGLTISLSQTIENYEKEKEYEAFVKENGASTIERESMLSPQEQEIRKVLENIKL